MSNNPITIYIVGGSSAQSFTPDRSPLAGWGQMMQPFFDREVTIDNHSMSGKSSKSFIEEGRLQPIAQSMKQGDYLLIHFGHNDAAEGERHTEPFTTYPKYLTKYVKTAQSRQATPILVTPVSKRKFSDSGEFIPTLPDYAEAVRQLAEQLHVDVIDLNRTSAALFQQWGREWTQRLFLWLTPGEHPSYPDGKQDNSHFNEYGALVIAKLVVEEMRNRELPLASRLLQQTV